MKWRTLVLSVLCWSATQAEAQTPPCPRCTPALSLPQPLWNCLVARAPELQERGTSVVFFTLTVDSCRNADPNDTLGGSVQFPDATPPGTGTAPVQVYRLSQAQLACLRAEARDVRPVNGVYAFNFASCMPQQGQQ